METRKIMNLLDNTDNEQPKFATQRWCIIHDQNSKEYGEGNENGTSVKFDKELSN